MKYLFILIFFVVGCNPVVSTFNIDGEYRNGAHVIEFNGRNFFMSFNGMQTTRKGEFFLMGDSITLDYLDYYLGWAKNTQTVYFYLENDGIYLDNTFYIKK